LTAHNFNIGSLLTQITHSSAMSNQLQYFSLSFYLWNIGTKRKEFS